MRRNEGFDLVGLAAEAEEEDAGEVGVGGVADEDAAEKVGGFAVFGHAAAGAVGDGDDAIDIGVGAEDLGVKWAAMRRATVAEQLTVVRMPT